GRRMVELQVSVAGTRRELRDADGGEDFIALERGGEQVPEEFAGGNPALAARAQGLKLGVERQDGGRPIAGRVGVCEAPAQRSFIPHLYVADFARRLREQRALGFEQVRRPNAVMRGGRADLNFVAVFADVSKLRDAPEINQVLR